MPLFEVAAMEAPTPSQEENGILENLLVAPKTVIAKDGTSCMVLILQELSTKGIEYDPNRLIVKVRPF